MRNVTAIALCCVLGFVSAADTAAEAEGPLTLQEVGGFFEKLASATTSAQQFIIQKRAMKRIEGQPVTATFVVTDVKPVSFKGVDQYSVEGMNAEPAFAIRFYIQNEDEAININAGESITLEGTGQGFFTGKKPAFAAENARVANAAGE
jgi:hypothetical protein